MKQVPAPAKQGAETRGSQAGTGSVAFASARPCEAAAFAESIVRRWSAGQARARKRARFFLARRGREFGVERRGKRGAFTIPITQKIEEQAVALWLFKEEPSHYSFADLQRDRK